MAAVEYHIDGTQSIETILQGLPLKYAKKPVVATFRKAARPFTKVLRSNTPTQTGETRKSIKVIAQRGIGVAVGFSGKSQYMPGYFKAYWSNYGTLDNRNTAHSFVKPRKGKSASWSGGVRATGFVEDSWEQTKNTVETTIVKELQNETLKFLNKYKVN